METLLQDLRFALRTLARSPGFTAVTVLILALGIGAAAALFSVVDAVLLRPLPYPRPEQVVQLWQLGDEGGQSNFSEANFRDVREQSRSFAALARFSGGVTSVAGGSEPVRAVATAVSGDFFRALGVRPAVGRGFLPEEQREGGAPAAIVSHGYWRRYLGGDTDLSGRTLRFDGRVHAVVGVMPLGFDFPRGTEVWAPSEMEESSPHRTAHNWQVVGRLRDGVSPERAGADVSAVARRLKQEHGDDTWMSDAEVVPLHEQLVGDVRPALLVLLGAAGLLLLIACANVVNLLLARAASRRREIAVRMAIGAGRGRLVQQFLAESLVLALAGGALGTLLASWGVSLLLALEPGNLPRVEEVGVSRGVLAFALGTSLAVALALGLAAALRAGRGAVRDALAEDARGSAGGAASRRARGALVVSQVALSLVLLVGAGLLARSFLRLLAVDPGYRTSGATVMSLSLPYPESDEEKARLLRFHGELAERLRAIPGVRAVGGVNDFPLGGNYSNGTFLILQHPDEVTSFEDFRRLGELPERVGQAEYRVADEGYFRAMGIPLLRGRLFDGRDAPDAPHVAVVSESLARTRWPGEDPLGKLIQFGNMDGDVRPFTIVGVVGDVREQSLDAEPRPTFYGFSRQRVGPSATFHLVMAGGAPRAVVPAARAAVRGLAPEVPPRFRTIEEVFSSNLASRRFSLVLLGVFGAVALLLATAGVYGVISYGVAQRTREFGIRMALGARPGDVRGLVLRQGTALALTGAALGLAAAFAATRLLGSLLYGVGTLDVVTFLAVPALLVAATLLASWLPARRATRVSPMTALRSE
ncbi:MAG TPA: ABC transporter permease [Longimicrobiaceae bacterium]|nr:ABC transporter permease [Longimicrobiaceae bacterium]